jgi:hypothetical protein
MGMRFRGVWTLHTLVPVGVLVLYGGQRYKAVGLKDKQRLFVAALALRHQVAVLVDGEAVVG